jgi:hypothetical protein
MRARAISTRRFMPVLQGPNELAANPVRFRRNR